MSAKKEMSMRDTINEMRKLLTNITTDLEKSDNGNKAASQRVRTGTVKLEKIAKHYRKVSIQHERHNKGIKKAPKVAAKGKSLQTKGAVKTAQKAKAPALKPAAKNAAAKPAAQAKQAAKPPAKASAKPAAKSSAKGAAKPKAAAHKTVAKPHAFALRRPTAKLPVRKTSR